MSKIKSLQYLLLDTLRKKKLNKDEHNRISKSLKIKLDNDNYLISWLDNQNLKKIKVDINKFRFYSRNDIANVKSENFLEQNNKNAKEIVDEIVDGNYIATNKAKLFSKDIFTFFYFSSIFFIASYYSNIDIKINLIAIFFVVMIEIILKSNKLTPILLLIISILKPDELLFFASIFYLVIYIFDTYSKIKFLNYFLLLISIYLNSIYFKLENIEFSVQLLLLIIIYFIIMLNNFFRYNSKNLWIYVFPSFSFLFFFEGFLIVPYLILILCYAYYNVAKLLKY